MSEATANKETSDSNLYPIRTVSNLTGVNAITLRAWERRYELFSPVRKSSGHRLYTQAHIDLITRVVGLLDRGMRIGQVKAQMAAETLSSQAKSVTKDAWTAYMDRMISAVIQFNEQGLDDTYAEALALYPVEKVTDQLLKPLLKELGNRWNEDQGSIAEEHFFSFYLRNKLGARFHHRQRAVGGPKLLLACLPGDRHETGLLLFALAANSAGYQTVLLGSDMPLAELPATTQKTSSAAIILSGMIQPETRILDRDLPELARTVKVPVFLGGQASVKVHDALKRADVHVLGTDLHIGLQRIRDIVPLS